MTTFALPATTTATRSNVVAFPVPRITGSLRRPAALVRAARAGQPAFRRDRDLSRLLRVTTLPGPGQALPWLRAEEDRLNDARLAGEAEYDLHRHVLVLIALLAEMTLAARACPRAVPDRCDLAVSGL